MKKILKFKKNNLGQSLVETIVALGIIVTSVIAILSVGLVHTVLGGESAQRVMATNLAREGLEIVYAIVESNRLDPAQDWPYGIDVNDKYIINYNATELSAPASFTGDETIINCDNCYLCQQVSDLFTPCAGQEVFRRMITLEDGDDLGGNCVVPCEKKITSTVHWIERSKDNTVSLELRLTDWR